MRLRARQALTHYKKAEAHYQKIQRERQDLHDRQQVLMEEWVMRWAQDRIGPGEQADFDTEMVAIGNRLDELLLPWQEAQAAMASAYEAALTILRENGFERDTDGEIRLVRQS